jgi:hypothetical protein
VADDTQYRVFLDMDGVLVNFIDGACLMHGKANPWTVGKNRGSYDIGGLLGMTPEEFWGPLGSHEFWANLSWLDDGREILSAASHCAYLSNIYLLSSPGRETGAYSGKAAWVKREIPDLFPRLLLSHCKDVVAKPGHVLVDDYEENCKAFTAAGGTAILVPRLHNSRWKLADQAFAVVERELWEATS